MLVRPVTRNDLPDLLRLYRQLTRDEVESLPADSVAAKALFDAIEAQPGRELLVAEIDGKVVGTLDLLTVPNLTHGGSPWGIVENVVVDEGSRGRGIGRLLMEEAVRRCKDAGCYKVQLLSNKRRTQAHEFYRSVGFEAMAEGFRRCLDRGSPAESSD